MATRDGNYIKRIIDLLDGIQNDELVDLVLKLVDERNYLIKNLNVDPLTGVYNRRILDQIRDFSCVAICDIDDFKSINDDLGHPMGDMVLQMVAQTLVNHFRINDFVCRYGGDEFLVVFGGAAEEIVEKRLADVCCILFDKFLPCNHKITLSIGVSSYRKGASLESTIKKADKALYFSKQNGKNMITCYEDLYSKNNSSKKAKCKTK